VAAAAPPPALAAPLRFAAAAAAALQLAAALPLPAAAMWDGESPARNSCALGEEGAACRRATLAKDFGRAQAAASAAAPAPAPQLGISPVAEMGAATGYARETADLAARMELYAGLDPYDAARPGAQKALRADGQAWVSKYARGGSARTASARKFYVAVDALQGHFASNGLAPLPAPKVAKLRADVGATLALLGEGK
jgi:hypothetical protein